VASGDHDFNNPEHALCLKAFIKFEVFWPYCGSILIRILINPTFFFLVTFSSIFCTRWSTGTALRGILIFFSKIRNSYTIQWPVERDDSIYDMIMNIKVGRLFQNLKIFLKKLFSVIFTPLLLSLLGKRACPSFWYS
jgi:hypothetical protein